MHLIEWTYPSLKKPVNFKIYIFKWNRFRADKLWKYQVLSQTTCTFYTENCANIKTECVKNKSTLVAFDRVSEYLSWVSPFTKSFSNFCTHAESFYTSHYKIYLHFNHKHLLNGFLLLGVLKISKKNAWNCLLLRQSSSKIYVKDFIFRTVAGAHLASLLKNVNCYSLVFYKEMLWFLNT